ncbi:MAG: hypothetical protein EXR52_07275 [Dehalococcoidia bacterium]|nr:hypothetical protein [Dehalococcoidia bacterium]
MGQTAPSPERGATQASWSARRDVLVAGLLAAFAIALSLPGLGTNPPLNYDEGYVLQSPMNLVQHGFYGTIDAEWHWAFDPHVTTGLPFTLPVALSYALFGVGVAQARIITVLFAGLAAASAYGMARQQASPLVSGAAAALLTLSLYPHNRIALGEVPALALALAGGWLWLRALERPTARALGGAGLVFGLAALTKLAMLPILGVALVGVWTALRLFHRLLPVRALMWPVLGLLGPTALWPLVQLAFLGPVGMFDRLAVLGDYQQQIMSSGERILTNAGKLGEAVPASLLPWAAPTLLAGVAVLVQRDQFTAARLLPWGLLLTTGAFYFFLSTGWARYGFWMAALLALLAAVTIPALVRAVGPGTARMTQGLALAALLLPAGWWAGQRLGTQPAEVETVTRFLQEQAGAGAIGSTEWELDLTLARTLQHPPTLVATVTQAQVDAAYDWAWPNAEWVVIGLVGKALRADEKLLANPSFVERLQTKNYRVFQRYAGPAPGWTWSTAGATATVPLSQEPAGQTFTTGYDVLTEVRVLLSGNGATTNAPVRMRLYAFPPTGTPLAETELSGATVVQNRWYGFDMPPITLQKGQRYYFEVASTPSSGQTVATAWYQESVDNYPGGQRHLREQARSGDLYFGVLGYARPASER